MVLITINEVPGYLSASPLLAAFTEIEAGDTVIEVPEGCAKFDTNVSTKEDFEHLLATLRHWQVPEALCSMDSMIHFLFAPIRHNLSTSAIADTLPEFFPVFPILQIFQELLLAEDSAKILLAIQHGQLLCLTYFHEELSLPIPVEACEVAVASGHLVCLKYVHQKGCTMTRKLTQIATMHNHLNCLRYVMQHVSLNLMINSPEESYCVNGRVYATRGEVRRIEGGTPEIIAAIAHDQIKCLQLLWREKPSVYSHAYHAALRGDSIQCVQFMHAQGVKWNEKGIAMKATRANAIHCLKYFRSHGCAWNAPELAVTALQHECVDCLVYLLAEIDFYFPTTASEKVAYFAEPRTAMHKLALGAMKTMRIVAAKGTVSQLVMLREKGYRMGGTDSTTAAAGAGNLECLTYLHQQGCVWDENAFLAALEGDHLACLQYLHSHQCPYNVIKVTTFVERSEQTACVQFMRQRGL